MAITRTPIVDDDGSGTTGTTIDNAWKQQFYDQIDGMVTAGVPTIAAPFRIPSLLTFALTVPQYNDFAPPNGAANVVWLLQGNQASALSGITAEAPGTLHLLINGAGFAITLKHGNASSVVTNRFLCPALVDFVLPAWYTSVWIQYLGPVAQWLVLSPRV